MTLNLNDAMKAEPDSSSSSQSLTASGHALLQSALAPVRENLVALEPKLLTLIPRESDTARSVIEHVFSGGGKRIRPALYFFCCRMLSYQGPHLYPIAAVCEYVHTASLLHDDVVDNSTLRRNKPTANSVWGDESSVLVGDLVYARASELMAASGSLEIVETFARAIRLMSEGELYQLEALFNVGLTEHDYFRIVDRKTAVLISACCRAAAILGEASSQQKDALTQFGSAIGYAFQVVDDALDYLGTRELFGKPTRSDLIEGKITLPVILLREHLNPTELTELEGVVNAATMTEERLEFVSGLVAKHGTAERAIERAQEFTNTALENLRLFPATKDRQNLEELVYRLVWRSS